MGLELDARSFAVGALVVLATLGAATPMTLRSDGLQFPDGSVQTSAALRKTFYLSTTYEYGDTALTGCDAGFHMASLWEILDVGSLRYGTYRGFLHDDSGYGPPTGSDAEGWIRTGAVVVLNTTEPGRASCSAWTSEVGSGTTVRLSDSWQPLAAGTETGLEPWRVGFRACSDTTHVWCVSD